MKKDIIVKKAALPARIWLAGAVAGFVNGLLGAGSGVILVFIFSALSKKEGSDKTRDNFAMTIATVLPISVLSAYSYFHNADISYGTSLIFLIPGMIGGVIGAVITDKINTTVLKAIFAAITVTAGINMIIR